VPTVPVAARRSRRYALHPIDRRDGRSRAERRECAGSPWSSPSLGVQLSTDVARCSLPTRRGVTGLRVAAGAQMPVDVRANVPAAGSRILPDRTRAACGMSGRTAGQVIRGDLTRAALSARARPIRQPVTVPRHVSGRSADARRRRLRQSAGHLQADAPDVLAPAAPSGTEPPARNARCVAENSPWHVSQAHRSSLGNRSPCTQPATRCGGKPKFPKGSTDFDAERLGKNLGRGVESTRVRSWRR